MVKTDREIVLTDLDLRLRNNYAQLKVNNCLATVLQSDLFPLFTIHNNNVIVKTINFSENHYSLTEHDVDTIGTMVLNLSILVNISFEQLDVRITDFTTDNALSH